MLVIKRDGSEEDFDVEKVSNEMVLQKILALIK